VRDRVAASTQNQALAALMFLYAEVLRRPLGRLTGVARARERHRLPVVLSRSQVRTVLDHLTGGPRLVAVLLYGAGLRLHEALTLRVKDVQFGYGRVVVRAGKGGRDRVTVLPREGRDELLAHLRMVCGRFEVDLADPRWSIPLPDALARKYPTVSHEWTWYWVFPASRLRVDAHGGRHRHHLHPTVVPRAFRAAVRDAGLVERATCHFPAPLIRDVPAGERVRHPDRSGVARPQGRPDDHDLHPRAEPARPWRPEPARSGLTRPRPAGMGLCSRRPSGCMLCSRPHAAHALCWPARRCGTTSWTRTYRSVRSCLALLPLEWS